MNESGRILKELEEMGFSDRKTRNWTVVTYIPVELVIETYALMKAQEKMNVSDYEE